MMPCFPRRTMSTTHMHKNGMTLVIVYNALITSPWQHSRTEYEMAGWPSNSAIESRISPSSLHMDAKGTKHIRGGRLGLFLHRFPERGLLPEHWTSCILFVHCVLELLFLSVSRLCLLCASSCPRSHHFTNLRLP